MKLIAILLSIVMTGAPNSMTNQGSLFTSANVLTTIRRRNQWKPKRERHPPSARQSYTGSAESSDMMTGKRA